MSDFQMGTTKLTQGYEKGNYYRLELGDNFYRVLPPLYSLAQEGKVAQFHAYHMGFKNTDGKTRPFSCIEKIDYKTKLIQTHCAVCDDVSDKEAKIDAAKKTPGVTEDQKKQIQEYFLKQVLPFKANRGYFLNVIDQKGEIGVLQIPSTAFKDLQILLGKQSEKGFDPTGVEGAYINFKKTAPFKGSKDTKYSTDLAMEQSGEYFKIKKHTLTPEIIESLKTKARDLSKLYKSITGEEISMLQAASGDDRAKLVDRIFGKAEEKDLSGSLLSTTIPGTTAQAVGRLEVTSQGVGFAMPNVGAAKSQAPAVDPLASLNLGSAPAAAPAAPAAPAVDPLANLGLSSAAPVSAPTAPAATPQQAAPAQVPSTGVTSMSDDDFARMFQVK